jgi:ABC-type Fe3+-hydroxamate transport system substrate-binding protein
MSSAGPLGAIIRPAARVPNLGDGINPNVEAILAARPTWWCSTTRPSTPAVSARLRGLGIPTLRINTDRWPTSAGSAACSAGLTGRSARPDSLAAAFDTALAAAPSRGRRGAARRCSSWSGSNPDDDRPGSFLSELVERAGEPTSSPT